MPFLELDQLTVDFRRYHGVLRRERINGVSGISFGLDRGELLAVVGASGAGKSLIVHAILGTLPGNAEVGGQIFFEGKLLDTSQRDRLRGRRITLVPQSIGFLDPLARIGSQLRWAAARAGIAPSLTSELSHKMLRRFDLPPELAHAFPHQLSGGMARRVLLAIAMIGDADLIIADEPTTGLDPANIENALQNLRALADAGKSVMLISHDIEAALTVADRVAVLRDGKLQSLAPASAFAGDGRKLESFYARLLWQALPCNAFIGALSGAEHT